LVGGDFYCPKLFDLLGDALEQGKVPLEREPAGAGSKRQVGLFYALQDPPLVGLVGDYFCWPSSGFGGAKMIFLETSAKAFLGLHLLAALATLFFLFLAVLYLLFREEPDWQLGAKLTLWGSAAYVLTWALGLLIYPVFRVKVRAAYFDPQIPWATGLFEVKEHVGSLGLFAALALVLLTPLLQAKEKETEKSVKKLYLTLLILVFLITVFKAGTGFFLRGLKSV
jgi:hypothetical protein